MRSETQHINQLQGQDKQAQTVDLDNVIKDKGYNEGKLFVAKDKATYTFLNHDSVISIHFDVSKRSLYLQGHKISNIDSDEVLEQIISFKKILSSNQRGRRLLPELEETISKITHN